MKRELALVEALSKLCASEVDVEQITLSADSYDMLTLELDIQGKRTPWAMLRESVKICATGKLVRIERAPRPPPRKPWYFTHPTKAAFLRDGQL